MKRFLLPLVCCSPLLLTPSLSLSVQLTGPSEPLTAPVDETPANIEQYGPINSVETLWAISSKLKPNSSVSVQQTMVAIYKSNPSAFLNGDLNRIIPGSILIVPRLDFVQQQTNQEAIALIKRFSTNKNKAVKATQATSATKKAPSSTVADAKIVAENQLNKQKLQAAEQQLTELQAQMSQLNEELIVATQTSQVLKLRLGPLNEQITTLTDQLDAEIVIQQKLQQIIDDYRNQLALIEPAPFSGEGMLNRILRFISASATSLLLVIFSPIIVLLLLYVVIARIRSKRKLAEQEQELAESTAILMQETGQFDTLLTEDFANDIDPEVDFNGPEVSASDDLIIPNDAQVSTQEDKAKPTIVDSTEQDQSINSADDPFGIGSLSEDEALISAIDLDQIDTENEVDPFANSNTAEPLDLDAPEQANAEDDPFGINALVNDEAFLESVDLDADEQQAETSADDPFGISALVEGDEFKADAKANADAEDEQAQSDLELAAAWEAQISADAKDEVDNHQATENDANIAPQANLAQPAELDQDLIDNLLAEDVDVAGAASAEASSNSAAELDQDLIDNLFAEDFDAQGASNAASTEAPASSSAELDQDLIDNLFGEDFDAPLAPQSDSATASSSSDDSDNDLLAKQISDVAFNEQVSLPTVEETDDNEFIDIETLLENSGDGDKDEPYSELELDLGLDEFPDVVDLQESVDIDDDENGIGAQLDLARAYLEIDDKAGAKEILMSVLDKSDGKQRAEIEKLLSRLA